MYTGKEKLRAGLRVLNDNCDEADRLALALIRIHGAAEDYLRETLANKLPLDQMARMKDPRATQWQELIELGKKHLGLSEEAGRKLIQANYFRQQVAHGGAFVESRRYMESYATLVQSFYGMKATTVARPADKARPARTVPARTTSLPLKAVARPADKAQPAKPAPGRTTSLPLNMMMIVLILAFLVVSAILLVTILR